MNNGDRLYDWVLHFNYHTNLWEAARRDDYANLFNGGQRLLRSDNVNTLIELIIRTQGSEKKLNELVNGNKA